ncbi:MAG: protein kinase domain-containing protein [Planctomycetota bacterium]|jgi:predicted Ser/Thr protein kinase
MGIEGQVLGRCRILHKIGQGGMGAVYKARHETLAKDVAVKVLNPGLPADDEYVQRFLREARAAASLDHPNVIRVLDAGSEEGIHFIVMEFVDGSDLETILEKKGKIGRKDALAVTKKVAQALGAAHDLGMVHRDIKPANIMITKKGKVMVSDFGLARNLKAGATVTAPGEIIGTPHYLSPEQANGEKIDGRSDLYSLGASLYCMLTGRTPFEGTTPVSIAIKHADRNARPVSIRKVDSAIPKQVEALVDRLMEKDVAKRFQSAAEVVEAVDRARNGGESMVRVSADRVLTPKRRRRILLAGAGLGILGLFALVFFLALVRGGVAEHAFRDAGRMQTDAEKLVRYQEIVAKHPDSRWAERARAEIAAIRARMLETDLGEIEVLAATPDCVFGDVTDRLDETRKEYPEAAAEIDRRGDALHRTRILERSKEIIGLVRERTWNEITAFIDPVQVRERGAGAFRAEFGVLQWLVTTAGVDLEDIRIPGDEMEYERRKAAKVSVTATAVNTKTGERKPMNMELEWVWSEGDWYLKPRPKPKTEPKPKPKSRPRDWRRPRERKK